MAFAPFNTLVGSILHLICPLAMICGSSLKGVGKGDFWGGLEGIWLGTRLS